ncbi:transposase [Streptomyces decoyicus]
MGRCDLTDAEWERLRPFLPATNRRCGLCRDHRQVIDGILHRVRTGVQWRDLPERFGSWKSVYDLIARTSPGPRLAAGRLRWPTDIRVAPQTGVAAEPLSRRTVRLPLPPGPCAGQLSLE